MKKGINKYGHLKDNILTVNGLLVSEKLPNETLSDFLTRVYHDQKIDYPKFFKMDILCKLAFILSEFMFEKNTDYTPTSIVLANRSSSLMSDITHEESIKNPDEYYPSPAVFVYTLPNIMIGEISIRHNIRGENIFFASENIDLDQLHQYCSCLLANEISDKCLVGWVNVEPNNEEGFMALVENQESDSIPFEIKNLSRLYHQELCLDTA